MLGEGQRNVEGLLWVDSVEPSTTRSQVSELGSARLERGGWERTGSAGCKYSGDGDLTIS